MNVLKGNVTGPVSPEGNLRGSTEKKFTETGVDLTF